MHLFFGAFESQKFASVVSVTALSNPACRHLTYRSSGRAKARCARVSSPLTYTLGNLEARSRPALRCISAALALLLASRSSSSCSVRSPFSRGAGRAPPRWNRPRAILASRLASQRRRVLRRRRRVPGRRNPVAWLAHPASSSNWALACSSWQAHRHLCGVAFMRCSALFGSSVPYGASSSSPAPTSPGGRCHIRVPMLLRPFPIRSLISLQWPSALRLPNPSIERTCLSGLRPLSPAAHVER